MRACSSVKAVPCGATTFVNARFEQRDQIELAFADDRAVRLDQPALRFVQAEEHAAFAKERRLRRVQIFRRLASSSRMRPLNAITSPTSLQIGNMSRPRKRS